MSYDADSGQLTVCPESAAWATKTRLEQVRIIAAANQSAGRTVIRTLRILAPGTVPVTGPSDADPKPAAAPAGPPRTRKTASDGYRRELSTRRETAPPSRVASHIAETVERQTAAMRELSRRAFPEAVVVVDDALAPTEQARTKRRRQADVSRAAALRRACAERAAGEAGTARGPAAGAAGQDCVRWGPPDFHGQVRSSSGTRLVCPSQVATSLSMYSTRRRTSAWASARVSRRVRPRRSVWPGGGRRRSVVRGGRRGSAESGRGWRW